MSISQLLRIFRANMVIIVLLTIVGAAIAALLTITATPKYSAQSSVFVSTSNAASISDLSASSSYAQQLVASYVTVAKSEYILGPVVKDLGLRESVGGLASRVSVSSPVNTVVMNIEVSYESGSAAAKIANEIAIELGERAQSLAPNPRGSTSAPTIKITQISSAVAPLTPETPKPLVNILAGGLLGVVAGLLTALLRQSIDTRVREGETLEALTSAPVLGVIPFERRTSAVRIAAGVATPATTEAFRSLSASLRFLAVAHPRSSYVVTSSVKGEGKSTTAVRLASAAAAAGARVLLIDADLRLPAIARELGLEGTIGLTSTLTREVALSDAIQRSATSGAEFDVLTSGPIPPNPTELLQSVVMRELLETVSASYDLVLIDSPPLLPVADAGVIASLVSGAIFLSSLDKTTRHQVTVAMAVLHRTGGVAVGTVLTKVRRTRFANYTSPYYSPEDSAIGDSDVAELNTRIQSK